MPEAAPALVELVFLALVFFTIALAFSAEKIVNALLGPLISVLKAIPLIGGKLASPLAATAQAVTHACGTLVSKCEALVGSSFHVLARFSEWLWRQTVGDAAALLHVAKVVGNGVYGITGLRTLVHAVTRLAHDLWKQVHAVRHDVHRLTHRVRVIERDISQGIGEDVLPRLRSLDRELDRLKNKVIPKVRAEAEAAEADVTALGEYVKDHYLANTEAELAAAVAVGLAALGLGGLRCNSNPWKNNRNACGLWGDLSELLGLALALGVALDFETFVHDAQVATEATVGAVESFVGLG